MYKALDWIGNYSRFSFNETKDDILVLKEQGRPLLDDELNFNAEAMLWRFRRMIMAFISAGSPDTGFKVVGTGTNNDFTLKAGRYHYAGWLLTLDTDIVYSGQPVVQSALTTPGADRVDKVYLDIWYDEIDGVEDETIIDPTLTIRTSCRLRLKWAVKVAEGGAVPVDGIDGQQKYHWYSQIATINRPNGVAAINANMVTDNRKAIGPAGKNPPKTVTEEYTVTEEDGVVFCDTTESGFTVTLPDPSTLRRDAEFVVKNVGVGGNILTIATAAGELDGQVEEQLGSRTSVRYVHNGTDYESIL